MGKLHRPLYVIFPIADHIRIFHADVLLQTTEGRSADDRNILPVGILLDYFTIAIGDFLDRFIYDQAIQFLYGRWADLAAVQINHERKFPLCLRIKSADGK